MCISWLFWGKPGNGESSTLVCQIREYPRRLTENAQVIMNNMYLAHVSDNCSFSLIIHMNTVLDYCCC